MTDGTEDVGIRLEDGHDGRFRVRLHEAGLTQVLNLVRRNTALIVGFRLKGGGHEVAFVRDAECLRYYDSCVGEVRCTGSRQDSKMKAFLRRMLPVFYFLPKADPKLIGTERSRTELDMTETTFNCHRYTLPAPFPAR